MKQDATLDDLVDQVGNLTSATTDLLNATSTSKATLDQAVDEAKGHAESAGNANTSAVNAKEEAKTAAAEAKEAEANATAIVHNDEGSVTPGAGKYPVADSKGHLDIGWTPLLQAMYPYSGVIGSVDKKDLLDAVLPHVPPAPSWANLFKFRESQFNIAGRFVQLPDLHRVYLPKAESTADRAIAFDDIFLDWNGEITTYRSITPHRTTTGYDRDAIATEHGYSKIQTGLYKTGDTYALLLGRVARRNQGAYHPVYNPEGSTTIKNKTNGDGVSWWRSDSYGPKYVTSTEQCFDFIEFAETRPSRDNGTIAGQHLDGTSTNAARSDTKKYDAIYADDFTPLYFSAKNVVDRQALLFDSFNRAVAGETFSGAEGTPCSNKELVDQNDYRNSITSSNPASVIVNAASVEFIKAPTAGAQIRIIRPQIPIVPAGSPISVTFTISGYVEGVVRVDIGYTDGSYQGAEVFRSNGIYTLKTTKTPKDIQEFTWDADGASTTATLENITITATIKQPSARPKFLMVDIIGSLDAMPDEWKQ